MIASLGYWRLLTLLGALLVAFGLVECSGFVVAVWLGVDFLGLGAAPDPEALHAAVASLRPGRTFIQCVQGHGRIGLFALALLLHAGVARSVEEGLAMLSAARPGMRLNREQLQCMQMVARELG